MSKKFTIVAYQGGKSNLSKDIVDKFHLDPVNDFYDLCCGTGAISIELVTRGYPKNNIYMIDAGPWGKFWEVIGKGKFDFQTFKMYMKNIPKDLYKVKAFMLELSKQPADVDTSEVFILLQSASFGGKAISIKDNKWTNSSFRDFWKPTETSNRRSTVKPMVEPSKLIDRVKKISDLMFGVNALCSDISACSIRTDSTIYIDPPYEKTTGYGYSFSYTQFIQNHKHHDIYVSEAKPIGTTAFLISSIRPKGGISGSRKNAHEEWLTFIPKQS